MAEPITFLVPLFASILQGSLAGGLGENARARQENTLLAQRRARRQQLQPLIDKLTEVKDYFDLDEQFTRDFSRAANQLSAQAAQTGMTNAGTGGLDHVRGDTLAAGLAQLALAKQQDEARRQQLLAELLSDTSLYEGMQPDNNVGLDTLLGGLLGGAMGAGSNLASYFGTEAGMQALSDWLGGNQRQKSVSDYGLTDVFGAGRHGATGGPRPVLLAANPQARVLPPSGAGGNSGTSYYPLLPGLTP